MALIKICNNLLEDIEIFDIFFDFFDSVAVEKKYFDFNLIGQTTVFRVMGEGIPEDDTRIDLILYKFQGVRPFVLEVLIYEIYWL